MKEMPEYKEYALQGGRPVRISPFDAAEAGEGVHFAEEGCAFNPVIVAGGGGNPNYVETIEGTLANPWGSVDPSALHQSVLSGDASAMLDIDATVLGFGRAKIQMSPFTKTNIHFYGVSGASSSVEQWQVLSLDYELNGIFEVA